MLFRTVRVLALLALGTGLLFQAGAAFAQSAEERPLPDEASLKGVPGNLAVIDVKTYQLGISGGTKRLLVRSLVENQTPIDRDGPWRLQLRRRAGKEALGTCRGEILPRGRVAVCEIWVDDQDLVEGEALEAALDRSVPGFAKWDKNQADDVRGTNVRSVPEEGQLLRVAQWELRPMVLQGTGEVNFRFTVEGAHLVWLLSGDKPPRLLAGHPADGVLTGQGRLQVRESGPVTIVARNSLGAFVYQAVPILNTYQPGKVEWLAGEAQQVDGEATARILDAGVYDVEEEDGIVLSNIQSYLAAKEWAAFLKKRSGEDRPDPVPAGVLNPKAKDR
ncbi:MAG: hypothetical protein KBD01_09470 [Acidobacteria bacterium]|nr:hypothetical protein [Acidobacteriota bacterium]